MVSQSSRPEGRYRRQSYHFCAEPSSMSTDSRPDIDALRASLLRTVKYNTSPQQSDSIAEHVLVEEFGLRSST